MYEILINVLIFAGILLLLALTVGAVIGVLMMFDILKVEREFKKKIAPIFSALDIISLIFGGLEGFKNRAKKKLKGDNSTVVAFAAGLKKGLQVFVGKDKEEEKENG